MTESISTHEDGCPLVAVDRRLQDAHRLWHQAEESYFDPDGFRIAAQNTVQTLRTVTFILQKHKRLVPDFDMWYGVKEQPGYWQKRLAADPLMCWMKDARNRIEKQRDLEANSFVRAEVLASYLEEGPRVEVPAHLFRNPAALMQSIPEDVLRKHGTTVQEVAATLARKRRLYLVGIGTSWHAALVAGHWFRRFAPGTVTVQSWHSFEFCAYPPELGADDAVIIISHRGTKTYSYLALEMAKASGAYTVSITSTDPGPRIQVSDVVLNTVEPERSATQSPWASAPY